MKTNLQELAYGMGFNIGFLFQKQSAFEKGLAMLKKKDAALASYLLGTRSWAESIMLLRNDLEHASWTLPRVTYTRTSTGVSAAQPKVDGRSITEFVTEAFDRLSCFSEELIVHGLQQLLPAGFTVVEIPFPERPPEAPERFNVTLTSDETSPWRITYHTNSFNDT